MKRSLLLLLLSALSVPAFAQTAWRYDGPFPADSTRLPAGSNSRYLAEPHGIAVDAAGRVWIQGHRRNVAFVHADTVLNGDVTTGTDPYPKVKTQLAPQIFVYNPDGTPAPFSPITFGVRGGVRTDTIGVFCSGMRAKPAGSGRMYRVCETRTGRGMRASTDGRFIYASFFDSVFRFDASNGDMLGKVAPYIGTTFERASLSGPAIDDAGNVYIATVAAGAPVKVYSDDLTTVITNAATPSGLAVARTIDVSRDGLRLYYAGYTLNSIQMFTRANDFSAFNQTPVTVLKGIAAEATAIHPTTDRLWVASGGGAASGKAANGFPGFTTNYQNVVYYSFDRAEIETNERPTRRDSIVVRNSLSTSTPRGIAFNRAGTIAYVADFGSPAPTVERFSLGPVAVEREGVATGVSRLLGNAPNPFSGTTTIGFTVEAPLHVSLVVYDGLGRAVRTLVDETMAPGTYRAGFEADGLPTGVYFYRLTAGSRAETGSMTIVR